MTCKNCNKELENGAKFCPDCGAKLTVKYTKVFENSGLGSKGFIEEINAWFAANPNVANVKCKFTTTVGFGLLVNHYKFKKLVVEYELFSGNNTMQYTVTKKEKFGLIRSNVSDMVDRWKKENSDKTVVNWSGGHCARGQSGSLVFFGLGAFNRATAFILYKSPRNK